MDTEEFKNLVFPKSFFLWKCRTDRIVPDRIREFNWFVCAARYWDSKINQFVIDIPQDTKFYSPKTGQFSRTTTPHKLVELTENINLEILNKNKDFHGLAIKRKCEIGRKSPVCFDVLFYFNPAKINIEEINDDECEIIEYSKKYNSDIREFIPKFPNLQKIDSLTYDNKNLNKILFSYLIKYFK